MKAPGGDLPRRALDTGAHFDANCKRCDRLARHLRNVKRLHPDYHCAPVPASGDARARLLIVGLAPGLHGANRSGRPFTGDYAGILLRRMLHKHGYTDRAASENHGDEPVFCNCRVTNAVKCLPPGNKPNGAEIRECNRFLQRELATLPAGSLILALGRIAHAAVLRALGLVQARHPFRHGAARELTPGLTLLDCYHCSRYNVQTGRLTPRQLDAIFRRIGKILAERR